jgi:hypothetical protein
MLHTASARDTTRSKLFLPRIFQMSSIHTRFKSLLIVKNVVLWDVAPCGFNINDVSEECLASIFRVKEIVHPSNTFPHVTSTLKMEATLSSETSDCIIPSRRYIPGGDIRHSHRTEKVRSYTALLTSIPIQFVNFWFI